jgi:hypothetical protein
MRSLGLLLCLLLVGCQLKPIKAKKPYQFEGGGGAGAMPPSIVPVTNYTASQEQIDAAKADPTACDPLDLDGDPDDDDCPDPTPDPTGPPK